MFCRIALLALAGVMSFGIASSTLAAAYSGHSHVDIIQKYGGSLDLDDDCLFDPGRSVYTAVTPICSDVRTLPIAPKGYYVTMIAIEIDVASSGGYGCIMQPLVNQVAAGAQEIIPTDTVAGTLIQSQQGFAVTKGQTLSIQMLDGAGALICDAGTNPRFVVTVFGYWTEP